jgi:hypothetical protein
MIARHKVHNRSYVVEDTQPKGRLKQAVAKCSPTKNNFHFPHSKHVSHYSLLFDYSFNNLQLGYLLSLQTFRD